MKLLAFLFLTGMIVNVMADDSSPVNGRLIIHADQPRGTINRNIYGQFSERPGWVRLRGRKCPHSFFEQSLIARRLQSLRCTVETCVEFEPIHFTQMAGLVCWYDTRTHYYLRITRDETRGKVLGIVLTDDGKYDELADSQIAISDWKRCHLRAMMGGERLQFSASADGQRWQTIGPALDATKLADDYGQGLHFTGALVGLCAQDLAGTRQGRGLRLFRDKARSVEGRIICSV